MMDRIVSEALAILQNDWVIYAVPVFLAALALEWYIAWRKALPLYHRRDFFASMGVMGLTVVIDVLPKLAGVMLMFICWENSPFKDVISLSLIHI